MRWNNQNQSFRGSVGHNSEYFFLFRYLNATYHVPGQFIHILQVKQVGVIKCKYQVKTFRMVASWSNKPNG